MHGAVMAKSTGAKVDESPRDMTVPLLTRCVFTQVEATLAQIVEALSHFVGALTQVAKLSGSGDKWRWG